jgi:hypothetical protein
VQVHKKGRNSYLSEASVKTAFSRMTFVNPNPQARHKILSDFLTLQKKYFISILHCKISQLNHFFELKNQLKFSTFLNEAHFLQLTPST